MFLEKHCRGVGKQDLKGKRPHHKGTVFSTIWQGVSLVEVHGGLWKQYKKHVWSPSKGSRAWSIYKVTLLSHWLRAASSKRKELKGGIQQAEGCSPTGDGHQKWNNNDRSINSSCYTLTAVSGEDTQQSGMCIKWGITVSIFSFSLKHTSINFHLYIFSAH